ncbi:MAG: fibrobacter succinogenes major paralogous domain-containing protein [Prolixibacteraceae bacterium]|nr:fibrobacter succinogenes major paralogous domain-containing protein [Prolixibacteraceae bacterium]
MKPIKYKPFALFVLCMFLSGLLSIAQAPEKVSYQSVIRDASGELVRSQIVGMQISIVKGSVSGKAVYVETHTPTTNVNGLASVEVGTGTSSDTFSDIDWSDGPYFLKVETDPTGGMSYSITGTTEILSIPYALYSKKAETVETETQGLSDVLGQNNNGNATQIKNIANPTDDQDATTKTYVDKMLYMVQEAQKGFFDSRDGTHYEAILIGNQLWMAENLKYLPSVSPPNVGSTTAPYYYVYGYEGSVVSEAKAANYETYGVLYNWPAALTACPSGWHLPTDAEWTILGNYLANKGYGFEASGTDIAKALASNTLWLFSATAGTPGNDIASNNSSGFGAIPGGYRINSFSNDGIGGYWWSASASSSTLTWYRSLNNNSPNLNPIVCNRYLGYSVRCVRD